MANVVDFLAADLNSIPNTSIALIIPPNQPEYGKGKVNRQAREKSVAQHKENWRQEFESNPVLSINYARALLDQESVYSDERALSFEIWVVTASSVEDDMGAKKVFGNSTLVKRKAIPGPVQCLTRSSMANWSKRQALPRIGTRIQTLMWSRSSSSEATAFFLS